MTLVVITYLAGVLTILSPCILPMLPFVFSKSGQSFARGHLPLLAGMALTFSILSALTIVGGAWVGQVSGLGRAIALVFMTIFGLTMVSQTFSDKILGPITRLGSKIGGGSQQQESVGGSFLIGISTGLLWAPCAGPILGLVLTGAASQSSLTTSIGLLLAYSAGAATSLSLALFGGKKLLSIFKTYLGFEHTFKKIVGICVLLAVVAVAFNLDRTLLTQISKVETVSIEDRLLLYTGLKKAERSDSEVSEMPEISDAVAWLNTPPLTKKDLLGKVVVIDFWTYSCINCLRTLPYTKAWAEKYKDDGLIVLGVHTPEFAFEKDVKNVEAAVRDLGITYPIAIDSEYKIWNKFSNQFWPAHYFVDRKGLIRHHHFGEGAYDESEKMIRQLLAEDGHTLKSTDATLAINSAKGVEASAQTQDVQSPETYIGFNRSENFTVTEGLQPNHLTNYHEITDLQPNQWSLNGQWLVEEEKAVLKSSRGKIVFRFHARDLHLVLGGATKVKFKVSLDGQPPKSSHGADIDENGLGEVTSHRLYQLIRQSDAAITDHTFEIEFLEPNVEAFAFTFG